MNTFAWDQSVIERDRQVSFNADRFNQSGTFDDKAYLQAFSEYLKVIVSEYSTPEIDKAVRDAGKLCGALYDKDEETWNYNRCVQNMVEVLLQTNVGDLIIDGLNLQTEIIKDDILGAETSLLTFTNDMLKGVGVDFSGMSKDISGSFDSALSTVEDFVLERLNPIGDSVKDAIDSAKGYTDEITNQIGGYLKGALGDAENLISESYGKVTEFTEKTYTEFGNIIGSINDQFTELYNISTSEVSELISDANTRLYDTFEKIGSDIDSFSLGINNSIKTGVDELASYVNSIESTTVSEFKTAFDTLKQRFEGEFEDVSKFYEGVIEEDLGTVLASIQALKDANDGIVVQTAGYTAVLNDQLIPVFKTLAEQNDLPTKVKGTEETKKTVSSFNDGIDQILNKLINLDGSDKSILNVITDSFRSGDFLTLLMAGIFKFMAGVAMIPNIAMALNQPRLYELSRQVWSETKNRKLSTPEAAGLLSRGFIAEGVFTDSVSGDGYDPTIGESIKKSAETPIDLDRAMRAKWRELIDEGDFQDYLTRQGYNERDRKVLSRLGHVLPNIQDIISMSVRDVFNESIASSFGLFDEVPDKLKEYIKLNGMDEDWAKYYWGAHWHYPSALQGFEMFHRGIIDADLLSDLLKALDIAPKWREKLILMSYNPITRVDIRRMYKMGVVDLDQVERSYLDLGYSPENARLMTEFTQYDAGEIIVEDDIDIRSLTMAQIKSMWNIGTLTEEQARQALIDIRYSEDLAKLLITSWKQDRSVSERETLIKKAVSKAVSERMSEHEFTTILYDLDLTSEERDYAQKLYSLSEKNDSAIPTKSELNKMLEAGIISFDKWSASYKKMGYSDDWIQAYQRLMGVN